MTYTLPPDWTEKCQGPPPSDLRPICIGAAQPCGHIQRTGSRQYLDHRPRHVLHACTGRQRHRADQLHERQFAGRLQSGNGAQADQDRGPLLYIICLLVAGSAVSLVCSGTQIRCHTLQIVLTSRDSKLLERLILDMNRMKLPEEASPSGGGGGGAVPVCIKNYVGDENMITRVNPVLTEHRFNPVPVRIIIDKKGKVKHIHFLSAFPDQARVITDALNQWKFKPYRRNGQPIEVETGIMFGRAPGIIAPRPAGAKAGN
jgi:hypothetical protein